MEEIEAINNKNPILKRVGFLFYAVLQLSKY